jgi:hypothetical protein
MRNVFFPTLAPLLLTRPLQEMPRHLHVWLAAGLYNNVSVIIGLGDNTHCNSPMTARRLTELGRSRVHPSKPDYKVFSTVVSPSGGSGGFSDNRLSLFNSEETMVSSSTYKRQAVDLVGSIGRSIGSVAKELGLRDSALRRVGRATWGQSAADGCAAPHHAGDAAVGGSCGGDRPFAARERAAAHGARRPYSDSAIASTLVGS